jgi:hypothetical protein
MKKSNTKRLLKVNKPEEGLTVSNVWIATTETSTLDEKRD